MCWSRGFLLDVVVGELFAAPSEELDVCSGEQEVDARCEVAPGQRGSEGVDPDPYAGCPGDGDAVLDRRDDVRVVLLPEDAHGRGEVGRPDEDAVDARGGHDRLDVRDGL